IETRTLAEERVPGVVRVKTSSEVEVEVGVLDRCQDEVRLRADDRGRRGAGYRHRVEIRVVGLSRKSIAGVEDEDVATQAHFEPDPVADQELVVHPGADGRLVDVQLVDREKAMALHGAVEAEVDQIRALLDGELTLHGHAGQIPEPRVARTAAEEVTLVVL